MEKYYAYSVKDELERYFSQDTIVNMRAKDDSFEDDVENITALAWAYADQVARGYFLGNYLLKETILCDDYIVYIVQTNNETRALISFMHFENCIPFDLDTKYAYDICSKWKQKGYDAVIMRNCIGVNKTHDGKFHFGIQCTETKGTDFLIPVKVEDKYIFLRENRKFWSHANALLISAITSGKRSEYERLFKENALVTRSIDRNRYDKNKKKQPVVSGIDNIKEYFDSRETAFLAYVGNVNTHFYQMIAVSQDKYYVMTVDTSNQICEITEESLNETDIVIPVLPEQMPHVLPQPAMKSVRPLDIEAMHAYAVQITYADGCVKNYYLKCFDTLDIPKSVDIDGFKFDEDVLQSVRITDDGVTFSNGYVVPAHLLYYRGVVQLVCEKFDTTFENETLSVKGLYRTPMRVLLGHTNPYMPRDDAFYGANEALLDKEGNRITDYSGTELRTNDEAYALITRSESNGKLGYLKRDGTWLVPPIFDLGEAFVDDDCVTAKIGNKKYLVNARSEIIPFDYKIDIDYFCKGLCAFSVKEHHGKVDYPEEEYFEDLSPGLWGFIDKWGKVVIEPQYVFTTGFGYEQKRAFVAKIVNGETLWGLIDEKGNEVIPCIYPNLATHHGTAVNFQREKNGKYGIMDFDGNVIMEPRYDYILEYNREHGLVIAGEDYLKGVARVDDGEVIIPFEDVYISFDKEHIEVEGLCGGVVNYDYDGNKFSIIPDRYFWEKDGKYYLWKENKCGAVDKEGNVVVPFIFEETNHIDYYEQGYLVTGTKGKYGLSTLDGRVILPEKYSKISVKNEFVIASENRNGNWNVSSKLFLTDGTPVFDDLCRDISIGGDRLSRKTVFGIEYYRIKRKSLQ